MTHTRVLIVHPEAPARALMTSMLQTMGFHIDQAESDRIAVRMLEQTAADLVLTYSDLDDPDAMEFLAYQRRKHPETPLILLYSGDHCERLREATQWGVDSALRFPMPATQLRAAVAQALGPEKSQAAAPPQRSTTTVRTDNGTFPTSANVSRHHDGFAHLPSNGVPTKTTASRGVESAQWLGEGFAELRQALDLAESLAPTSLPVLIEAEPGTGKSLIARTLHERGPRAPRPFVELNCASMSEDVLDVELFGRMDERGRERPGNIAKASGGTLLLDAIDALSPELQLRLLRLLQVGEYEPIGARNSLRADVRLVVATKADLFQLADQGRFCRELAQRLGTVTLKLPELRQHATVIERLAEHFRARYARELHKDVIAFSPEAREKLRQHSWPGNIRELEHVVEHAVVLCRGRMIEPEHLVLDAPTMRLPKLNPAPAPAAAPGPRRSAPSHDIVPLKEALEAPEKQIILQALEALNWNRQETARVLDINRTTLYKKMKKYDLLYDEPVWAN